MRSLIAILLLFWPTVGLAQNDSSTSLHVRSELTALIGELNAALKARDRAALEQIYAEEFVWVHGVGYVDDRKAHLDDILAADGGPPVPLPSFDPPQELLIYANGQVAVLRGPSSSRMSSNLWGATIYVKRDGRWRIAQIQGTEMQPPRQVVTLDPRILESIAGTYERAGGLRTLITREGDRLVVRHPGIPPRILTPTSGGRFYDKLGSEWRFTRAADGRVTEYVVTLPTGVEAHSTKVP
jgi:hypothetical protein